VTPAEVNLDALLDFVKRNRGFDFTGYKRSSLERRIRKRMEEVGCETYADYLDHLEVHQDEFAFLFNTVLINVTGFFRDAAMWEHLRTEVVPGLVVSRPADAPIRVWCAGCASGEEAYTVAMVLADVLGDSAYRERVKIYATDVDDDALQSARQASYPAKAVESVPREVLERYFERYDSRYVFRTDLRRTVIFGRNDLVQDAPISRIDLLVCRNTLMYFNAETQAQILRRFHFGLDDGGVMVLGKSEMLITHGDLFQPLDLKRRVFRKVRSGAIRDRLQFVAQAGDGRHASAARPSLRDSALDAGPVSQVVIDGDGRLATVNHAARELFALTPADVGRSLQDLELSYRPVELRSHLDRLLADARPVALDGVRWAPKGDEEGRVLDVRIAPLFVDGELEGATVAYEDVTRAAQLEAELEGSKRELEQAYEELQSTVEELETTNEELQSTNEELETANEELQSTNEELETMNEELQSANEELETINDELRTRTLELNEVNAFLETILASMGLAVVVLDGRQTVQVWNRHAEDLWGLRADEAVGQHFLGLDIGLPVDQLRTAIRDALRGVDGRGAITLQATNRRGRPIECAVRTLPMAGGAGGAGRRMSVARSSARRSRSLAACSRRARLRSRVCS
jgi:two-component system CheB/CheR fusion protein